MAIQKWSALLGNENVLENYEEVRKYVDNVSSIRHSVLAVLFPKSTEDVKKIVEIANESKTPLYPISKGKNWGLGSRMPVIDGCAIVDLSKMNRISNFNMDFGTVEIEPGVTQKQLYDYLKERGLPYMMNITAAGVETSFIGCALDRGLGYFSPKEEDIFALEVVLGNGNILNTGFSHYKHAKTVPVFKYGVGAFLDGLFFQSNFGIVTKATLQLIPVKEETCAIFCSLDADKELYFSDYLKTLGEIRKTELFTSIIHIINKNRSEIQLLPLFHDYLKSIGYTDDKEIVKISKNIYDLEIKDSWSATFGVTGTKQQVKEIKKLVTQKMSKFGKVNFLTDAGLEKIEKMVNRFSKFSFFNRKKVLLNALKPYYKLTKGIPTDLAIKCIFYPVGDYAPVDFTNPDQSFSGYLMCLPIVPFTADAIDVSVKLTEKVFNKYGFKVYVNINIVNQKSLEFVISLAFNKTNDEETQKAIKCIDELHSEFYNLGYIPYRVGIQSMEQVVQKDDYYWQLVKDLKTVLDPNCIISPKRYNLV